MLETLNMSSLRCPVGLSDEIIAVFLMKTYQIDTENDKNAKDSSFRSLYAIFVKFSPHLVDWSVQKGQEGENSLFNRLFRRANAAF